MGLFANFVDRAMKKKTEEISARAELAGKKGVEVARSIVPVRTGRLRDSIGFTWNQGTMTLSLFADAPYAYEVAKRSPFMKAGRDAMRQIFTGGTSEIQFATLPEKYQERARKASMHTGHVVIGHRKASRSRR